MNIWLHLVRKDWQRFRLWFALSWAACLPTVALPWLAEPGRDYLLCLMVAQAFAGVACLLAGAQLLQLDSFSGTSQFLATRPVPRGAWIGAKLALILAGLVLPLALSRVLHLAACGLGLDAAGFALALLEHGLTLTFWTLLLLAPALFTRRLGTTLLVLLVGAGVAFVAMHLGWRWLLNHRMRFGASPDELRLWMSRSLLAQAMGAAALLALHVHWARRRRWWSAAVIAVAGAGLALAALKAAPWNFAQTLAPEPPALNPPPIERLALDHNVSFQSALEDGRRQMTAYATTTKEAAPAPWVFEPEAWRSSAEVGPGVVLRSAGQIRPFPIHDPLAAAAIRVLSERTDEKEAWSLHDSGRMEVLEYFSDELPAGEAVVTITGEATMRLQRPRVVAELPLVEGAMAVAAGVRYTLTRITPQGEALDMEIAAEQSMLRLRGDVPKEPRFLLINRETGAFYDRVSGSSNSGGFAGWAYRSTRRSLYKKEGRGATWPEQLAGMKLCIVLPEEAGTRTLPFRLDGVKLDR